MQKLKLSITPHDVSESEWFRINNPILFVLQNTTGTLWQMREDGSVIEAMAPYRTGQLSAEPLTRWRQYQTTGQLPPFEFDLELRENQAEHQEKHEAKYQAQAAYSISIGQNRNSPANNSQDPSVFPPDTTMPEATASESRDFKAR